MILEIAHKGKTYQVIYDDEDHGAVSRHTWYIDHGYARTKLWEHGERYSLAMHRLILESSAAHTHHINGNRLDNRRANLLSMSTKDHAEKHHKKNGGENRGWFTRGNRAKLTDSLVLELRRRYKLGESGRKLARELGLGHTPVRYAITGKTWKHLPL